MTHTHSGGRFRANPIEIAMFVVISGILVNSIYSLLYEHSNFQPVALSSMSLNPVSEGRTTASITQSLVTLEIPCEESVEQETLANKVRLSGLLCGASTEAKSRLTKTKVVNTQNHVAATVFSDIASKKYSTDYIPLSSGKNPIHLEFSYSNGKVVSQDLIITKN